MFDIIMKQFNIEGRATRKEFWVWTFVSCLVVAIVTIIDMELTKKGILAELPETLRMMLILPNCSVAVRRLHDIDRSGWWLLMGFTVIGMVVLLAFAALKGNDSKNRFGDART